MFSYLGKNAAGKDRFGVVLVNQYDKIVTFYYTSWEKMTKQFPEILGIQ
jgi:hypothetical protein